MNNDSETMQKEAAIAYLKALSWHLPGAKWGKPQKPQSGLPISGPRFKSGTSQLQSRSTNHSAVMFNGIDIEMNCYITHRWHKYGKQVTI